MTASPEGGLALVTGVPRGAPRALTRRRGLRPFSWRAPPDAGWGASGRGIEACQAHRGVRALVAQHQTVSAAGPGENARASRQVLLTDAHDSRDVLKGHAAEQSNHVSKRTTQVLIPGRGKATRRRKRLQEKPLGACPRTLLSQGALPPGFLLNTASSPRRCVTQCRC